MPCINETCPLGSRICEKSMVKGEGKWIGPITAKVTREEKLTEG
jgi:hypothetical protein